MGKRYLVFIGSQFPSNGWRTFHTSDDDLSNAIYQASLDIARSDFWVWGQIVDSQTLQITHNLKKIGIEVLVEAVSV